VLRKHSQPSHKVLRNCAKILMFKGCQILEGRVSASDIPVLYCSAPVVNRSKLSLKRYFYLQRLYTDDEIIMVIMKNVCSTVLSNPSL